jgi:hypothetical protein
MNDVDVLSRTYPARISAVEALLEASKPRSDHADAVRRMADALDEAGPLYGRASTAAVYAAFAELMRIVAMLVDWREATLTAGADAQRFLVGARERYKLWCTEYANMTAVSGLLAASAPVAGVTSIHEIEQICETLARQPLPVGIFADDPVTGETGRKKKNASRRSLGSSQSHSFVFVRMAHRPMKCISSRPMSCTISTWTFESLAGQKVHHCCACIPYRSNRGRPMNSRHSSFNARPVIRPIT